MKRYYNPKRPGIEYKVENFLERSNRILEYCYYSDFNRRAKNYSAYEIFGD